MCHMALLFGEPVMNTSDEAKYISGEIKDVDMDVSSNVGLGALKVR